MTNSSKRSAMLGTGIVALIVGLLAATGLWYSAVQRESDAVRNLARAPSGCDTTLDFEAAGEFTIYIETKGRFDEPVAGDCAALGAYGVLGEGVPAVSLTMTSPTGDEVALTEAPGATYDADGFIGQSVRTFQVETAGDHILRVEADDDAEARVVVAVGRDPSDGVAVMQWGAVLAAIAGLMVGGGMMIAARRASASQSVPAATEQWPVGPGGWPTTPPGMPTPPAPGGWQPAVGPPSAAPGAPAGGLRPQTSEGWPATPVAPESTSTPSPSGPPSGGPASPAGSSDAGPGGERRSPWAPPSDPAQ